MGSRQRNISTSPDDTLSDESLLVLARQTQQARINCSDHFPRNVFRDSAWDIMLELFITGEEGRVLCVKDVMVISGESATGTIRRIEGLEAAQLVTRDYDPRDHRRILVNLSERGREAMESFLRHLFEVGGSTSQIQERKGPASFSPTSTITPPILNDDRQ
ncbi:MarR family transcriptional regulator [Sphingobium sp. MP9-4]|uniref:MarR family transcriptional regulator n=1 Tax=Sphingobium sp. MP9-4 TaxID=1761936 RepID=UPI0010CA7EC5|nr:MarR family transcriptional regulator [Sphingobium sp. MP9-4]